jgi:hypothetical protein
MDFFLALFRLLCESVKIKLRKLIFKENFDLKAIGRRQARQQLGVLIAAAVLLQIPFVLLVVLQENYFLHQRASQQVRAAERGLRRSKAEFDRELSQLRSLLKSLQESDRSAEAGKRSSGYSGRTDPYSWQGSDWVQRLIPYPDADGLKAGINTIQAETDSLKAPLKSLEDALKKLQSRAFNYNLDDISDAQTATSTANSALSAAENALGLSRGPGYLDQISETEAIPAPLALDYGQFALMGAVEIGFLAFLWWAIPFLIRFNRLRKEPMALGLLVASDDLTEYLDFELTRSKETEINIPLVKDLSGTMKTSSALRSRSISLPGLTSQYIAYVRQLLEVIPNKLLVCIDELDKVTDLDSVKSILREIKGGLYVKGCFYVISLSEDSVQAFGGRLSSTRDIFESTFDEVYSIARLDIESCRRLLERPLDEGGTTVTQLVSEPDDVIRLCSILSSGIPRDLSRNFRECVLNEDHENSLTSFRSCWERLFRRKLEDLKHEVLIFPKYDDVRANLLEEIDTLVSLPISKMPELGQAFRRLEVTTVELSKRLQGCRERAPGDADTEEVAFKVWLRNWVELEVYVLSAAVVIESRGDGTAESLRCAYALLPYSIERTKANLKLLFPGGVGGQGWAPTSAIGTAAGLIAAAATLGAD